MTEEDVKRWLNRAKSIDEEINELRLERERAFDMATNAVQHMSNDRVQTSKGNNSEELYIAYAEFEGLINKRITELYRAKKEIFDTVNGMENGIYRRLLTMRYISLMTWEQIAEKMRYDIRWVYRLHKKALSELKEIIQAKEGKNDS